MRRATRSTMWLLSDDGSVQGLSLGSDFTSEHEWGGGWASLCAGSGEGF